MARGKSNPVPDPGVFPWFDYNEWLYDNVRVRDSKLGSLGRSKTWGKVDSEPKRRKGKM